MKSPALRVALGLSVGAHALAVGLLPGGLPTRGSPTPPLEIRLVAPRVAAPAETRLAPERAPDAPAPRALASPRHPAGPLASRPRPVAVAVPAPAAAEGLEKRAPASVENPPEPGQRADSAAADNLAATGTAPALAARAVSTAASFHANYLNNPAPAYPAAARRRRVEGTVLLEVTVGVDGRAREVRVNRSSGADDLDEAAMAAVRGWTFVPATRAGERIEGAVEVPVRFRLAASD